jgi:hypothetical protein
MTVYQIKPMKTFLETEVAWWNANVELTMQQVNTRITSYKEKLETLNKEFQINLDTAISLLPPAKAKTIVDKLAEIESAGQEGFADVAAPAASPAAASPAAASPAAPAATPSAQQVDLSGASASIDISSLQDTLNKKTQAQEAQQAAEIQATASRTWVDDTTSAAKYVFAISGIILYICIAIRFASFAANDLFYKPMPYRVLAFIYAFLFTLPLFPYYLYREFRHLFWPAVDAPHFEAIFPAVPYSVDEVMTIDKRIYGYADTPALAQWVAATLAKETADRLKRLESTVLQDLMAAAAADS